MKKLLIALALAALLACGATAAKKNTPQKRSKVAPPAKSPGAKDCPFKRDQVLQCFWHYIDTNKDKRVSRREMEFARNHYLGSVQKQTMLTTDQFLHRCDMNHDGFVNADEFEAKSKTCYRKCEDVSDFIHYICAPAQHEQRNQREKRDAVLQRPRGIKGLPQFHNNPRK